METEIIHRKLSSRAGDFEKRRLQPFLQRSEISSGINLDDFPLRMVSRGISRVEIATKKKKAGGDGEISLERRLPPSGTGGSPIILLAILGLDSRYSSLFFLSKVFISQSLFCPAPVSPSNHHGSFNSPRMQRHQRVRSPVSPHSTNQS